MIGKLHGPGSLFLRNNAGDAKDESGNEYELTYSMSGTPIVKNKKTNVWFTISWEDILNLAKEAGVDKPWKQKKSAA